MKTMINFKIRAKEEIEKEFRDKAFALLDNMEYATHLSREDFERIIKEILDHFDYIEKK